MTDTITDVPLSALRDILFNTRTHHDQSAVQELANSITAQGLLQPIVARYLPESRQDIAVCCEIVVGHRRVRASRMARPGLHIPTILREMTDLDAAIAQHHKNEKRQGVSPLEEADSFARMRKDLGLSADQIADAVEKSRSDVFGRLKLATMAPEVRSAVADGGLGAEVALEIARLRDHNLQRLGLKKVRSHDDQWLSYRDAKRMLHHLFDCDTAATVFGPADAGLVPTSGACTGCSRRAGNDPDLQGVLGAGVCTDRPCILQKVATHTRAALAALKAAGHPVIDRGASPNPHAAG